MGVLRNVLLHSKGIQQEELLRFCSPDGKGCFRLLRLGLTRHRASCTTDVNLCRCTLSSQNNSHLCFPPLCLLPKTNGGIV